MKKNNKELDSNFYKVYTLIVTLVFFAIAFVKITRVYQKVRFAEFAPAYAFVTLTIIGTIYLIIKHFSTKIANIVGILMYMASSLVLFIDCVYFSYMNKFTSIANLKLISLLDGIKESISKVNPLSKWWILADIPIILIFAIFINKRLYIFLSKKVKFNIDIKKFKRGKKWNINIKQNSNYNI